MSNKSATILVVDDENDVRAMFMHLLKQSGYQTLEATDGKAAVDLVKKQEPDLIVMDLMMPVMSGVEATKRIRQLEGCSKIPIIAVTAYDLWQLVLPEEETRLWQAVLKKPVAVDKFRKTVSELLGTRPVTKHGDNIKEGPPSN
jgi:two-component system, response regulator, stage 0 sporulation protein F